MVQITKINRDVTNFIYGYIDFQKIILYMQSFDVLCSNILFPPTSLAAYGKRGRYGRQYAHSQIYQRLGQLTMMRGKDKENAAFFL